MDQSATHRKRRRRRRRFKLFKLSQFDFKPLDILWIGLALVIIVAVMWFLIAVIH